MDVRVYQAMLNPLSNLDIKFLKAMAVDSGPSKMAELEARLSMSHSTAQTYRRRLLDAGVVVSHRRGELEFIVGKLGDYLRRV